MNPRDRELDPELRRVQEAVRGLPRPVAREAFRQRLKREFVSGAMGTARLAPARTRPALPWRTWVPAAAAAVLLVAAGSWLNRGPDWTLSSAGNGVAVIEGRPILLTDHEALSRALKRGGSVRLSSGASLELVASGHMAIELTAGTEATVPPVERPWFARSIEATVRSGEIRMTTGRAFKGARLAVRTPEAKVEVVGTTLAVICESAGTCVCVMDGRVMMGPRGAAMEPIEAGRRRFVFNDGRPPEEAEMRPVEKIALAVMRARHFARME